MSDVGEVAGAVKVLGQVALTFLNPSQQKLLAEQEKEQLSNENQFKEYLLSGDIGNVNRMLDGVLSITQSPELTSDQYNKLRDIKLTLDGASLLSIHSIGRENIKLQHFLQILYTTTKS